MTQGWRGRTRGRTGSKHDDRTDVVEDDAQDEACDGSQGSVGHPDSVHPKPADGLCAPDFVMLSGLVNTALTCSPFRSSEGLNTLANPRPPRRRMQRPSPQS